MKLLTIKDAKVVHCPKGGFVSCRFLVEKDKMGFAFTKTFIPKGSPQHWHYKHHLEACYCLSGKGILTDNTTLKQYDIVPESMYVLDKHESHFFQALEDTVLLCVFNPPLVGDEVHDLDGSYGGKNE